jgi:hypothetical protein
MTTTTGTTTGTIEIERATVAWEPCGAFHDDPEGAHGRCAACGWALDEHPGAPAELLAAA